MKQTIIAIVIGLSLALTANAGYNALKYFVEPPVWEYFPDSQNISTFFSNGQNIKVYRFDDGKNTCYIAVSPFETDPKIKNLSTSLSCVK